MADHDLLPAPRGDEAALFREYNDELMQVISRNVRTSTPDIVEDACAFAWAQFMEHRPDRERNWRGWLFRTAQRQAWILERQAGAELARHGFAQRAAAAGGEAMSVDEQEEIRDDVREALGIIAQLSPRLQRVALSRALGLRHNDIAELTGDSPTRVNQLILRANDAIHDILAARRHATHQPAPRAQRLWELERDPPRWLVEKIRAARTPLAQDRRPRSPPARMAQSRPRTR